MQKQGEQDRRMWGMIRWTGNIFPICPLGREALIECSSHKTPVKTLSGKYWKFNIYRRNPCLSVGDLGFPFPKEGNQCRVVKGEGISLQRSKTPLKLKCQEWQFWCLAFLAWWIELDGNPLLSLGVGKTKDVCLASSSRLSFAKCSSHHEGFAGQIYT